MKVSQTYCGNYFTIYINQILHSAPQTKNSATCPSYISKTRVRRAKRSRSQTGECLKRPVHRVVRSHRLGSPTEVRSTRKAAGEQTEAGGQPSGSSPTQASGWDSGSERRHGAPAPLILSSGRENCRGGGSCRTAGRTGPVPCVCEVWRGWGWALGLENESSVTVRQEAAW